MRNFDYIKDLGFDNLHRFCAAAEENQMSNPDICAISARRALEYLVREIYKMKGIEIAERTSLLELIDGEPFSGFIGDGKVMMAVFVSVFSLAVGVLYCIVSGLMAIDIVPRKATGAALGIVGISSYMTIGIQNIISGVLIDKFAVQTPMIVDGQVQLVTEYDFVPVAIFWLSAVLVSFLLPVFNWKYAKL